MVGVSVVTLIFMLRYELELKGFFYTRFAHDEEYNNTHNQQNRPLSIKQLFTASLCRLHSVRGSLGATQTWTNTLLYCYVATEQKSGQKKNFPLLNIITTFILIMCREGLFSSLST